MSRELLLARAADRLARLIIDAQNRRSPAAEDPPSLAYGATWGLLQRLTKDDGATPQIAGDDEGGVEVNWLVAGDWMRANIDTAGSVDLEAGWANGEVEFEYAFDAWVPDEHALHRATVFLDKISESIRIRVQ